MEGRGGKLVLTRKQGESVDQILEDGRVLSVTVHKIDGSNKVVLLFESPRSITILRRELNTARDPLAAS